MVERTMNTVTIFPIASDGEDRRGDTGFEDALARNPGIEERDPLMVTRYLVSSGQHVAALRSIQQVLSHREDPEMVALCCLEAGQIREQMGEFEAATSCYQEAAKLDPGDREVRYFAHNNLAYCLNRLGRPSESESECRKAIAIDGIQFNAHKNLGISLELQDRPAEATTSYIAAIRAKPSDPRALRRLRLLLARFPELKRDRPDVIEVAPPSDHALPEDAARHVERLLASISVDDPIAAEGLQVFGVRWDLGDGFPYRTLDEALATGALDITEVGGHGQVPLVQMLNRSDDRIFLMAGEELVGAKQNRILNASIMLGSRAEMPVPVSCVEQGRWAHRTRGFSTAGTSSHSALRYVMAKKMHESYRTHGSPVSDQKEVWREVSRKLSAHKTHSPSHALHEAFESVRPRLSEISEKLRPRPEWSGAVFGFGGTIAGIDLFDRPATLSKLWPKILRGYAIDAVEKSRPGTLSRAQVEDWLRGTDRLVMEAFPSPALGTDVRVEGERMVGAMLMVEDRPVHVEIFADDEM